MKFRVLLIFCALNIITALNLPENLTKKCEQSSFCRRCRNIEADNSPFNIVPTSVKYTENEVEMDILNNNTQIVLHMKFECLEDNTFHFDIDEKNPIKNGRFRLNKEVIDPQSKKESIQVGIGAESVDVTCGKNKAVLRINKFKIDFYRDGILTVTANGKGLMTYEHLQFEVTPAAGDDPDSWKETYMGVTDTKPNGPEAVALDFTFEDSDILFGIPEHHDTFALRRTTYGEPYHLFTNDATFFEVDSRMPNYGAIPVIYGHTIGRTSGIFWHNSADTYVDIHDTKTAHFITEAGIIDVYVFLGPTPNDAFSQYTKITGVGNLPQLFTLGYHQCRWSYMNATQVLNIVSEFDKYDIPLDTMWLDIDYTDRYQYFTWNKETFPNPLGLMDALKATGRRLVHIIDPHIKADDNDDYFFYKETRDRNLIVKTNDRRNYYGNCWPGNSTYLDYFNPKARKYYADQYLLENFKDNSVETGIWNDMNEPAVFDSPEKTFPRDNIHTNGEIEVEHRLIHNIYGFLQTKATFDGLSRRSADYRPFILTRSFFAGSQKYTALWTGDNSAEWPYLKASIQACLAISVSGMSFCGSDIGGFFGEPDDDLFVRWTQAAAFQPFFRNHASWNTRMREPYVWSNETRILATNAMRRRYEFLPFWYTLFYEHEQTGYPIMRPMLANYPNDKNIFSLDTQYMLGDKLLISPVLEPKSTFVIVRFPSTNGADDGDIWYDIYDNYTKYDRVGTQAVNAGVDKVPVFQRGGTIIPKKLTPRKSSIYMRDDPLSLFVAVDKNLKASGNVFIDDETSYKYRNGSFKIVDFKFDNMTLTVTENSFKEFRPKYDTIFIARPDKLGKAIFQCQDSEDVKEIEAIQIDDEYYSYNITGHTCDEMSWTLTLTNSAMMTAISKALFMSIFIFNVIKKLLF